MFERYTEKARRVIFFARYEASQLGSPYIETEHLLLGLLREDKVLTHRFFRSYASMELIRKQIEDHTVIREKVSTSVDLPLSNEGKRVLAYGAEEADRLSHKHIGTEHLLLGLLREEKCFAATLLNERDVFLDMARKQVGGDEQEQFGSSLKSLGLPAGYRFHKLLYNNAAETLILELRHAAALQRLPARLFVRRKDAEAYEPIGNPTEGVSYESPVTCEKHPLVLFNSFKSDNVRRGWDWDGVYSFNLNSKELAICISLEKLRLSEPHGRMWIRELVSLSEDARRVYVNISIEKVISGGGGVHHHLAEVDLADQEVRLLSRLMDTRF